MAGEEGSGAALARAAPSRSLKKYFEKHFVSKCGFSVCMSAVPFVGWSLPDISVQGVGFQHR